MFFRKKKQPEPPPPAEPKSGPQSGPKSGSADGSTTQFLTGTGNLDRRLVDSLLEAIARVSESRDLESLLSYIVDESIRWTGAERGLLLLSNAQGELSVRVARQRGGHALDSGVRF
jgi:hypothetical protein